VVVSGDGWSRSWPLTLRVEPPVIARAQPYEAGRPAAIELRLATDKRQDATIQVPRDAGTVQPAAATLEPGKPLAIAFIASPAAKGPVPLTLTLGNGLRQKLIVRPKAIDVPSVKAVKLDGRLGDWPAATRLDRQCFAATSADFAPDVRLAWSPDGLYVAAAFAVKDLKSGDPKWFWDNTNLELFADTSPAPHKGWGKASHQFWFTPLLEGGRWRLYAGEWKRGDAIAATIYDDKRCKTAIAVTDDAVTFEAFVPNEALGAAPSAGAAWRLGLALQRVGISGKANAAWPVLKDDGLLAGAENLGVVRFGR